MSPSHAMTSLWMTEVESIGFVCCACFHVLHTWWVHGMFPSRSMVLLWIRTWIIYRHIFCMFRLFSNNQLRILLKRCVHVCVSCCVSINLYYSQQICVFGRERERRGRAQ